MAERYLDHLERRSADELIAEILLLRQRLGAYENNLRGIDPLPLVRKYEYATKVLQNIASLKRASPTSTDHAAGARLATEALTELGEPIP